MNIGGALANPLLGLVGAETDNETMIWARIVCGGRDPPGRSRLAQVSVPSSAPEPGCNALPRSSWLRSPPQVCVGFSLLAAGVNAPLMRRTAFGPVKASGRFS